MGVVPSNRRHTRRWTRRRPPPTIACASSRWVAGFGYVPGGTVRCGGGATGRAWHRGAGAPCARDVLVVGARRAPGVRAHGVRSALASAPWGFGSRHMSHAQPPSWWRRSERSQVHLLCSERCSPCHASGHLLWPNRRPPVSPNSPILGTAAVRRAAPCTPQSPRAVRRVFRSAPSLWRCRRPEGVTPCCCAATAPR